MGQIRKKKKTVIKVPRFEAKNGFVTTKERSALMSKIKSKETKPEVSLRKALWAEGLRYRKNYKKLLGNPDIVITTKKIIVFIDGEFWHGYNWTEKKKRLKSNKAFWVAKIERNMQRDAENRAKLEKLGYKVIRFWEHEIKKDLAACVKLVLKLVAKFNVS